jgi:dihydrofolate reductase
MGRLLFSAIASLDGYTVDESGSFDWAAPDEEVHAHANGIERDVGVALYGRRMYETMRVWQELSGEGEPAVIGEFADLWRSADKVVYSTTLAEATTPRTRIERVFDPGAVRALVDASDRDVSIGGPTLASAALRAGVVDEIALYVVPVSVGGGTPALPDGTFLRLELLEERRFAAGTVFLRYRVDSTAVRSTATRTRSPSTTPGAGRR